MNSTKWLREDIKEIKSDVKTLAEEIKLMRIDEAKRTGIAVGKATAWSLVLTMIVQIGSLLLQAYFKI